MQFALDVGRLTMRGSTLAHNYRGTLEWRIQYSTGRALPWKEIPPQANLLIPLYTIHMEEKNGAKLFFPTTSDLEHSPMELHRGQPSAGTPAFRDLAILDFDAEPAESNDGHDDSDDYGNNNNNNDDNNDDGNDRARGTPTRPKCDKPSASMFKVAMKSTLERFRFLGDTIAHCPEYEHAFRQVLHVCRHQVCVLGQPEPVVISSGCKGFHVYLCDPSLFIATTARCSFSLALFDPDRPYMRRYEERLGAWKTTGTREPLLAIDYTLMALDRGTKSDAQPHPFTRFYPTWIVGMREFCSHVPPGLDVLRCPWEELRTFLPEPMLHVDLTRRVKDPQVTKALVEWWATRATHAYGLLREVLVQGRSFPLHDPPIPWLGHSIPLSIRYQDTEQQLTVWPSLEKALRNELAKAASDQSIQFALPYRCANEYPFSMPRVSPPLHFSWRPEHFVGNNKRSRKYTRGIVSPLDQCRAKIKQALAHLADCGPAQPLDMEHALLCDLLSVGHANSVASSQASRDAPLCWAGSALLSWSSLQEWFLFYRTLARLYFGMSFVVNDPNSQTAEDLPPSWSTSTTSFVVASPPPPPQPRKVVLTSSSFSTLLPHAISRRQLVPWAAQFYNMAYKWTPSAPRGQDCELQVEEFGWYASSSSSSSSETQKSDAVATRQFHRLAILLLAQDGRPLPLEEPLCELLDSIFDGLAQIIQRYALRQCSPAEAFPNGLLSNVSTTNAPHHLDTDTDAARLGMFVARGTENWLLVSSPCIFADEEFLQRRWLPHVRQCLAQWALKQVAGEEEKLPEKVVPHSLALLAFLPEQSYPCTLPGMRDRTGAPVHILAGRVFPLSGEGVPRAEPSHPLYQATCSMSAWERLVWLSQVSLPLDVDTLSLMHALCAEHGVYVLSTRTASFSCTLMQ